MLVCVKGRRVCITDAGSSYIVNCTRSYQPTKPTHASRYNQSHVRAAALRRHDTCVHMPTQTYIQIDMGRCTSMNDTLAINESVSFQLNTPRVIASLL